MTSAFSFHVIFDAIYQDLNPLRVALASLRPRVINIVGGARKTEAFAFAIELRKAYPDMRVIWRSYPDDGNHAKPRYALKWHRDTFGNLIVDDYAGCQAWIDDNYNYLLAGLTVLTDNESVNNDMDAYAAWQAKIMDLTGAKGFKVAVGRFAVGNPREADYKRMRVMWEALAKWHPLHTWSPNEYIPPDMKYAAGMINRYQQGIDAAKSFNAWPFDVSIGEYGIVYRDGNGGLDAEAGYRDGRIGWSGEKAFKYLYDQWAAWYKANGVDVCVYAWGDDTANKWARFRVDQDNGFVKALLESNTRGELEPVPTKPTTKPFITPMPKPVDATDAIKVRVKNANGINLRSGSGTEYQEAGKLTAGQEVTLYRSTGRKDTLGDMWRWVDINEQLGGWVCTNILQYDIVSQPVFDVRESAPQTPPNLPSNSGSAILQDDLAPFPPFVEISTEYALELALYYSKLAATWDKIAKATKKTA